jgi:hypothetical protein
MGFSFYIVEKIIFMASCLDPPIRHHHGLINYIDTKAKCHLKKFTCFWTLRQVLYRLVIQSVMLVFLAQLCELLPL